MILRQGARSPVSGVVLALVVLLRLVLLAGALAYVPMPAMAALLMVVVITVGVILASLLFMKELVAHCHKNQVQLVFSTWQFQPLKTLARARGDTLSPLNASFPTLIDAINEAQHREKGDGPA